MICFNLLFVNEIRVIFVSNGAVEYYPCNYNNYTVNDY